MQFRDLYLILSVVIIWGVNFAIIKIGLYYTTPFLFGALRFIPFILLLFFFKKPQIPWLHLILFGLVFYFGQFGFLFLGMTLGMPAGMASMVLQSQAFFTVFFAQFFLGETFKLRGFIGLIISALGLTVVSLQNDASLTIMGLAFTLAAAACWAMGNIIIKRFPKADMMSLTVWSGIVPIIPFLACAFIFDGRLVISTTWQQADWLFLFTILYIFLLATLYGNTIWGKLMRKYNAGYVAPFSLLVPIAGLTAAAFLLNEHLSLQDIIGSIIVMSGLIVNVFGGKLCSIVKHAVRNR